MDTRQKNRSSGQTDRRSGKTTATAQAQRHSQTARKNATANRARQSAELDRKKQNIVREEAPVIVYTPAKPFNRGKLLLQLITVVAVVLALSLGVSIFFKVDTITVSGTQKYDAWTVKEASGIEIGDNLLSFGEAKAAGKIRTALPYVDTVRIGIKLPDTVNIEIKELDVVYSIRDAFDQWYLITAQGRIVDRVDKATAGEYTEIIGVRLAAPVIGHQAVALEMQETVTTATSDTGETSMPVAVRASDRLAAVLNILQYLEDCGIVGAAASLDVTDLGNLELWYGQRFLVKLGDMTQMLYKIQYMNAVINGTDEQNTLKEYDSGILDLSFTVKKDQAIYQAFTD